MARYKCKICGYIYDEKVEGKPFSDLPDTWCCPRCGVPKNLFEKMEEEPEIEEDKKDNENHISQNLNQEMQDVQMIAEKGQSIISAMATEKSLSKWDDILILGNQLNPRPLREHDEVKTETIIGKKAKKPLVLESPIYISHMSFGALSKEAKISFAKASAKVKTATCSGEGGILPEEYENAYKYIFEYIPNLYSVNDENLKKVDAIEIKIGQGTKPGMGGHLPGEKVTEEIAKIRGKKIGEDIISPSRYENIVTKEDLKNLVDELRTRSEGRPIGIKIASGRIEKDLEFICFANPDFITIDGRGGATGASPKFIRDATSVPTIFALYRAKKYLKEHHQDIDLVITGGLRISSDFAKALAMGADAVAIATSAMIAAGCQQYKVCGSGKCPMGIATQDPELRKRLRIDVVADRVANFLYISTEEVKTFARITGHTDVHELNTEDLVTINSEISNHTDIMHV